MSLQLLIQNYGISNQEDTALNGSVNAAATALTVDNNDGFTGNDYVLVEQPGSEIAEIAQVASVTGSTTITTGALKFAHGDDTPLYLLPYNQIKIYRATSKSGTYSAIGTVAMEYDEEYTQYTDSTGSTSYWYKVTYYNSTTTAETDVNAAIAIQGGIDIVSTPAHPQANSYISFEEATTYFSQRRGSDAWNTASDNKKRQALIEATRLIDAYRFHYGKLYEWQRLEFPRSDHGRYRSDVDSSTTSTVVSADFEKKQSFPVDHFNYGTVWFPQDSDTHYGQFYIIADFDNLTGTITIDGTFDTGAPDAAERIEVLQEIPPEVKYATCETVIALIEELIANTSSTNIKREKLGDEEVEYNNTTQREMELPIKAKQLLQPYISTSGYLINTPLFR